MAAAIQANLSRQKERPAGTMRKSSISIVALLIALCSFSGGCAAQSDAARVDETRQLYVAGLHVIVPMLEQKVITDQKTLDAIYFTKNEIRDALVEAENAVASGNKLDARFWLDKALAALDQFLVYKYQVKRAARARGIKPPDEVGVVMPGNGPGTTYIDRVGDQSIRF